MNHRLFLALVALAFAGLAGAFFYVNVAEHVTKSPPGSVVPANLVQALHNANAYYAQEHGTFDGIAAHSKDGQLRIQANSGLRFVDGSTPATGGTEISIEAVDGQDLVVVGRDGLIPGCLGVLVLKASLQLPWFPGYAGTALSGTYYFYEPTTGTCSAQLAAPPASRSEKYLSTSGWPSSRDLDNS